MSMITMYDDINLALVPADAEAVAGYVNGRWPTYPEVVKRWPHAHHLSITVHSHGDAQCLDVELGDATNAVAPAWVKEQFARGVKRPVVYTSLSNAEALLGALAKAGIQRDQVRLWTAHYTGREHLCTPGCGFGLKTTADATQWTDRAFGRSLDRSLCASDFFGKPTPPKPPPKPPPMKPGRIIPNPTKPKTVPGWWYEWAQWRLEGQSGVRPARAPRIVPAWAWIMLHNEQVRQKESGGKP